MIGAALPFLSERTLLNRAPRFISTGLEGADVTIHWADQHRAVLRIREAGDVSAALMAGVLTVCFERMHKPKPEFVWVCEPDDSTLTISLRGPG